MCRLVFAAVGVLLLSVGAFSSPAHALLALSCGSPLTPGDSDTFNVSPSECTLDISSTTGAYLGISSESPLTLDFQVNGGTVLTPFSDPTFVETTNFELYFGPGAWAIGFYAPANDPMGSLSVLNLDLPLDGSFGTPLPAALPLFASGLGAMGLFGWRRKRKKPAAIAPA